MDYPNKFKKNGFTLLEIIIVITIFGIFASFSVSAYSNYKNRNLFKVAVYDIVESMRFAQTNAQKMKEDSKWGVKIDAQNVIVFKGNDYAGRDSSFDQKISIPNGITVTNQSEVVFEKITGATINVGTTTVTGIEATNKIYINEKGTITY